MSLPWHLIVFAALTLSAMFAAWLGVAGEVVSDVGSRGLYAVLKDFQTAIGAMIALGAAAIAIWNTTRTINNSNAAAERQRARKQVALRSVLPLTFSELSDFAERRLQQLVKLREAADEKQKYIWHSKVQPPSFEAPPQSVIEVLSDFIEHADERDVHYLQKLIQYSCFTRERRQPRLAFVSTGTVRPVVRSLKTTS